MIGPIRAPDLRDNPGVERANSPFRASSRAKSKGLTSIGARLVLAFSALAAPLQAQPPYDFYVAVGSDWQWGTCCYNAHLIRGVTPLLLNLWRPMPAAFLQPGDLTQWATLPEFAFAGRVLDHITVPVFTTYGNHDLDRHPPAWPASLSGWSTLPAPHNVPYRFATFSTPLGPVAVLSVGFLIPDDHIAWARAQLDANPTIPVILLTHSWSTGDPGFLWTGGSDPDHATTNSPAEAFVKLVEPYPQIRVALSGHGYGIARRTDTTALGVTVSSHSFNLQGDPYGGNEWLRLMAFRGRTLDLWTFAPTGVPASSINRTEAVLGIDLGQALTDPVPIATHHYGPGEIEDTWVRPIWGGATTNPSSPIIYGARNTGSGTAREHGLLKFRDPTIPAAVAGASRAMLTFTKGGYQTEGALAFHEMLRPWSDGDSWNTLGGLVAGVDYVTAPAFELPHVRKFTWNVPITSVPAHGWVILGTSTGRGGIRSSEDPEGPVLTVVR